MSLRTLSVLLPLVCSSLASASSPAGPGREPIADDVVEAAIDSFRRASTDRSLDVRRAALEALVETADLAAFPHLFAVYGEVTDELEAQRAQRAKLGFALERERLRLALLENSPDKKRNWSDAAAVERKRIAELEADLAGAVKKVERAKPWQTALEQELTRFTTLLSPADQKKLEKELKKDAAKAADAFTQLTAIDLLGVFGPDGTALDLHDSIVDWRKAAERHYKKLPKLMLEVRELEERMQKLGNSQDLQLLYTQARNEANIERAGIRALDELVDAAVVAAGRALARESGTRLTKSIEKLLKAVDKERGRVRLDTLALFGYAHSDDVRAALRERLATADASDDGLAAGAAIDALVALDDRELVPLCLDGLLANEHEYVRTRAAAALDALRAEQGIPALIERLDVEEGRARTDIGRALTSLTGKDFHGNVELWRRWWKDNADGFEVPPERGELDAEDAEQQVGVTFFGVKTESQRVLFVLDTSLSMTFTTAPRPGLDESDRGNWPRFTPTEGEIDRMTAARRALVKALGGLREGAVFNFVVYASSVWTWQDDLVEMDEGLRSEALAFIEGMVPNGGTNIHGAMLRALDLAGADDSTGGQWSEPRIDTIFLLTDGGASVGVTTDTEEILADIANRNRTAGIVIHTIGLSDGHDAELLRRLAEENGGTYVGR